MTAVEQVRKRPGMYVGSTTDGTGLHRLVLECVHNAINDGLAGYTTQVEIVLHGDGSCTVRDDGRGMPVDSLVPERMSAAEFILTSLHSGGRFLPPDIDFDRLMPGIGLAVVNALSAWLNLRIWRDGQIHTMRFVDGRAVTPLDSLNGPPRTGTEIRFEPAEGLFASTDFDFETLRRHMLPLAWLCPTLTITLTDERREPARVMRLSLNGNSE